LWPAHAVTALVAALAFAPITSAADAVRAAINLVLAHAAVPLTAWYYSLNAPSWSISTEMFFYAAFPFALWLGRRRPWVLVVIAIAIVASASALATALRLAPVENAPGVTAWGVLYISPFTRIAEFLTGIVAHQAALRAFSRTRGWSVPKATLWEMFVLSGTIASMVAITAFATAHASDAYEQFAVWVRVAGPFPAFAALLAVFYPERGLVTRVLGWQPLVFLGEISFALYLVHQLVIRSMFRFTPPAPEHRMEAYVAYWLISLAGAVLLHHLVEKPLRPIVAGRLARKTGGKRAVGSQAVERS